MRAARHACLGVHNLEAWRRCIDASNRHKGSADAHPAGAVCEVLMRLGGYGFSTSGVERLFATSLAKCHTGTSRTDLGDDHINDDLDLLDDGLQGADIEELVAAAQVIWSKVYNPPRTADRRKRIDLGIPHRSQPTPGSTPSLAAWQRQRHADIAATSFQVLCRPLPAAAAGSEGSCL